MLIKHRPSPVITGCAQTDVYCSKQPKAVAPAKPSPIISLLAGIGQKKTVDAAKICGGAENVVKTETWQTFIKWIARFYYFRHFILRWKLCVYCSQ